MRKKDKKILVDGFEENYNCTKVGRIKITDVDFWEMDALAHAELWIGRKSIGIKTLFFQFNKSFLSIIWDFKL